MISPYHISTIISTIPFTSFQMYSLTNGNVVTTYSLTGVREMCPEQENIYLACSLILADWEKRRFFICFDAGVVVMYSMDEENPQVCFRVDTSDYEHRDIFWINGLYLISVNAVKKAVLDFF